MGRDFPRRLELSFTKPENVANQDILTPKIIAVIPFGVQAMGNGDIGFIIRPIGAIALLRPLLSNDDLSCGFNCV
ncbi:MAG TPA: hypothetical protein VK632_14255 [Verrucomicrobiae bacterium]|nr:hypothetical protein [Verrucomicrobiae bacterium]